MFRRTIPALGLLALVLGLPGRPSTAEGAAVPRPADAAKASEKGTEATPPGTDSEHKTHDIMAVEPSLAIWTLVVFLGLMGVLGRFAWKPLMRSLHEREAHLEQVLLDMERARNEAEAISSENRRQLAQAADQARILIEEARKEALVAADTILRKAQAEAEASRDRAQREIAGAKDQALMEIWSKTADLAVSVAGRVLTRELGESDHRRLVDVALGEMPANGREGSYS